MMGVAATRGLACSMVVAAHSVARSLDSRGSLTTHAATSRPATPQPQPSRDQKKLFSVGVIADIQYADIDDGVNFAKTERRFYRGSLEAARCAVGAFNGEGVSFIAQLGDLIDGCNAGGYGAGAKWKDAPNSRKALVDVMEVLEEAAASYVHTVGNHELYNFEPRELSELLTTTPQGSRVKTASLEGVGPDFKMHTASDADGSFYFSFVKENWRFVVLNTFEESVMLPEGSVGYEAAKRTIERHNPNDVLGKANQGKVDFFKGLQGENLRYVPFNGGCGEEQRTWLKAQLEDATEKDQRVVIFTHLPLHPDSASWRNVAFDSPEVLKLLHSHEDRVMAVFAGHCHTGGYARDAHGIHHCTVQATLTHGVSFGVLDFFDDHIALRGTGALPSRHLAHE